MASGAGTIFVRKRGALRPAATIALTAVTGLKLIGYALSGDTQSHAQIRFSTSVPAASWTAAGGATPNLYWISLAANPDAVWEVSASGVITRLFYTARNPSSTATAAPSLAAANGQAGSFYYDAGAARLYVYPWGGTITGKSYEVPAVTYGLTLTNCAGIELRDIDAGFSRDMLLNAVGTAGRSENCLLGRSGSLAGTGNALDVGAWSSWVDNGSTFDDAGNDGVGHGVGSRTIFVGSRFMSNRGDGVSYDGAGATSRLVGCECSGNGKNGAVRIAGGATRIDGGRFTGNGDSDISANMAGQPAQSLTVDMNGVTADLTYVDAGASATVTAAIKQHRGPVQSGGAGATTVIDGVAIKGDGSGTSKNFAAVRCDGGTMTVNDLRAVRVTYGVMLTGGTLKLRCGQALRNTGAGLYQSGGTLDLDPNDPVNVYGNATAFSGVSAGDQAKTVAVAAV